MAITFSAVKQFNNGTSNTAAGGQTLSLISGDLPVGSLGIVYIFYDNTGAQGADPVSTISDSGGNTWTTRAFSLFDPGAVSAGLVIRVAIAQIVTAPTSIDVVFGIGCLFTGYACRATSNLGNVSFVNGGTGTGASTNAPTVTTSSVTINNTVIGFGGKKDVNTWVADADTLNGSWSTATSWFTGTSPGGLAGTLQSKVVTATGTQTYNPTFTTAAIRNLAWIQLTDVVTARKLGLLGVG